MMIKIITAWAMRYIVPILIVIVIAGVLWLAQSIFKVGEQSTENKVIKYGYQDLSKSIEIRERSDNCFDAGRVLNGKTGECK